MGQGEEGVSEIMINSLILILNKEGNPMMRGSILGKMSMTSFLNSPLEKKNSFSNSLILRSAIQLRSFLLRTYSTLQTHIYTQADAIRSDVTANR